MVKEERNVAYCFFYFPETISKNLAAAIIDWAEAFRVPSALMSDGLADLRSEKISLIWN